MQLSPSFLALALALGATIAVDAAPVHVVRNSDPSFLSLNPSSNKPALAAAEVHKNGVNVNTNLCKTPLGLVDCKTGVKPSSKPKPKPKQTKPQPKHHSEHQPKPQPKPKQEVKPKSEAEKKPHHTAEKSSSSKQAGGSAQGGNGGKASGGSSSCSTGNSLIGLNALNINSCNGGNGDASGGSAVGGHGGETLLDRAYQGLGSLVRPLLNPRSKPRKGSSRKGKGSKIGKKVDNHPVHNTLLHSITHDNLLEDSLPLARSYPPVLVNTPKDAGKTMHHGLIGEIAKVKSKSGGKPAAVAGHHGSPVIKGYGEKSPKLIKSAKGPVIHKNIEKVVKLTKRFDGSPPTPQDDQDDKDGVDREDETVPESNSGDVATRNPSKPAQQQRRGDEELLEPASIEPWRRQDASFAPDDGPSFEEMKGRRVDEDLLGSSIFDKKGSRSLL